MAAAQAATDLVLEACVLPVYVVVALPSSLLALAIILAVIRAKREDLPDLFRALWGKGDDDGPAPPSLPKS